MIEIFSIGYERHTPKSFFERLQRERVERLIDVRNVAASRKPGFSKKALTAACEEVGLDYVHLQRLGNPKEIRARIKSGKLVNVEEWKAEYAAYLATVPDEFARLIGLVAGRRSCLMCLEHSHTVCHRDVIIRELRQRMADARIIFLE